MLTGLIYLKRATSGGLLWTQQRISVFNKRWGVTSQDEWPLAPPKYSASWSLLVWLWGSNGITNISVAMSKQSCRGYQLFVNNDRFLITEVTSTIFSLQYIFVQCKMEREWVFIRMWFIIVNFVQTQKFWSNIPLRHLTKSVQCNVS
jgi:hypothetical protein